VNYRLEKQNEVILDSIRSVEAMQQEGTEIAAMLLENRQTIESVRNKVCRNIILIFTISLFHCYKSVL
jgi:hypothetical protein